MSDTQKKELNQQDGGEVKEAFPSSPFGEEPDPSRHHKMTDEIYTGQDYRTDSSKAEDQKEKKERIGKDISILVMITLVAGLLLGVAYSVTKAPIATAQARAKEKAQSAVMSTADHFEVLLGSGDEEGREIPDEVTQAFKEKGIETTKVTQIDAALDADGELIGYVFTVSDPDGYGGDVELMCGITPKEDGSVRIEGISFLSLSETAGMGMRAKDPEFAEQFTGRELEAGVDIVYTKNGASGENEIDAISGCTITTSAVTDDVNGALTAAMLLMDSEEGISSSGKGTPETEQEAS